MIRVLVAEDMRMLREALVELLNLDPGIEVVGQIEHGDAIVPAALDRRPDVAVIDIDLPRLDGLTAAADLRVRVPSCKALILTGLGRPGNLRRAINAQVYGFMSKDSRPEELAAAIHTVAAGERVIDQQLAYATLGAPGNPLTARELDTLSLAASGASPREISARLHLSYGTVCNYLASAVTKLDARNRVDAIRIATEAGWL